VDQSSQNFFVEPSWDESRSSLFSISDISMVFKVFVVKVESCSKSGRIFNFLAFPNFCGAGPQKWGYSHYRQSYRRGYAKFWANFRPPLKKLYGNTRPWWGVR